VLARQVLSVASSSSLTTKNVGSEHSCNPSTWEAEAGGLIVQG
jgi:hypothetical protein